MRAELAVLRDRIRSRCAGIRPWRAELLQAVVILGGWFALTCGIRSIAPRRLDVWSLSLGLLLMSIGGWRFVYLLFRDGLYTMTRARGKR